MGTCVKIYQFLSGITVIAEETGKSSETDTYYTTNPYKVTFFVSPANEVKINFTPLIKYITNIKEKSKNFVIRNRDLLYEGEAENGLAQAYANLILVLIAKEENISIPGIDISHNTVIDLDKINSIKH